MSFSAVPTTALTDAIRLAHGQGMFFAAAAGNTYGGSVVYPASLAEVVAVTAVDSLNVRADFAAIGSKIELSAPGVRVPSTAIQGGSSCGAGFGQTVAKCSGTSMAAPHVTAAAAVLKSYYPFWNNETIRYQLRIGAQPLGAGTHFGYGLVRVYDSFYSP